MSPAGACPAEGPPAPPAPPFRAINPAQEVLAVAARLTELLSGQLPAISAAADLLADRLLAGGTVHVFGTGHSRAVAMELAGRAGGLKGMREIVLDELVASGFATRDELLEGLLERRPEAAQALLEPVGTSSADAFFIVSNSGCNGAPVEMAIEARRRGLPVVALTSLSHSRAVASRHPSGLRLFEVATCCIDNCAPYADTALSLASGVGVCSVSSFSGVLIAQALNAEVVSRYLDAGVRPPVLLSRNLPTGPARL